jgi:formylglycine-generating enzyme required for sulfatase activity
VIAILLIWFILNSFKNRADNQVAELILPTNTEAVQLATKVEISSPTQTNTPPPTVIVLTDTPVPTEIPTYTPEPKLGIGDTLISPVDGSVMVFVPASEFRMGADEYDTNADLDEIPQITVYLDSFWIDQFEVTNRQYQACVSAGVCTPPDDPESATRYSYYEDAKFDNYPVINVTWLDASTYCQWRNARLPTEAEWEKAARGDIGNIYPWGDSFEDLHSNYRASTILCPDESEDGFEDTAPVGSFLAGSSLYGAHDMAGNVNEWVADWYGENYYASLTEGIENPTGPESGEKRSIRGGSFGLNVTKLRSTNRGGAPPSHYSLFDGFRCAQNP